MTQHYTAGFGFEFDIFGTFKIVKSMPDFTSNLSEKNPECFYTPFLRLPSGPNK